MCGIVGVAGDLRVITQEKVFRDLLDVCQVRGRHSTGVIKVDNKLDYTWMKQVGPPNMLTDTRMYEDRIEKSLGAVLVGHCRHKTVGDISVRNAHPFDFPEHGICGVHNGTLHGTHKLDTYHHSKVDSEVLYGHLSENGPEETFDRIEGAYACVWWNNENKELCFIRNDKRPLWFTWSKDLSRMYWASEIWMFGAVERTEALWEPESGKSRFVELPTGVMWRFKINPFPKKDEKHIVMRPPVEIKPRSTVTVTTTYPNYGNQQGNFDRLENGRWVRKEGSEDLPGLPTGKAKGGEVSNPFADLEDKETNADPSVSTAEDGTTTPISNVAFLKQPLKNSDSSTPPTNSTNSGKKVLSLPKPSSQNSPQEPKDEPSSDSNGCTTNITRGSLRRSVSFRIIAGLHYITDNKTSKEYLVKDLREQTNNFQCGGCKTHLDTEFKIGEIVAPGLIVCSDCLEEPKAAVC